MRPVGAKFQEFLRRTSSGAALHRRSLRSDRLKEANDGLPVPLFTRWSNFIDRKVKRSRQLLFGLDAAHY